MLKKIFINGILLNTLNYIFKPKDILKIFFFDVKFKILSNTFLTKNILLGKIRKKIINKKRAFYKKQIKKELSFFFFSDIRNKKRIKKRSFKPLLKNCLEINYRIASIIYIRLCFNNEIFNRKKKIKTKRKNKKLLTFTEKKNI